MFDSDKTILIRLPSYFITNYPSPLARSQVDLPRSPRPAPPRPTPAQAQTGRSQPSGGKVCGPAPQGRRLSEAPGNSWRAGECVERIQDLLGQLRGCGAVCDHVVEAAIPAARFKGEGGAGAGLPERMRVRRLLPGGLAAPEPRVRVSVQAFGPRLGMGL